MRHLLIIRLWIAACLWIAALAGAVEGCGNRSRSESSAPASGGAVDAGPGGNAPAAAPQGAIAPAAPAPGAAPDTLSKAAAPDSDAEIKGSRPASAWEVARDSARRASGPSSSTGAPGSRGPALKAALHDVHQALIGFYAQNSRFPKDRAELEKASGLAEPVARLEKISTGLRYSSDGGSFSLTVTPSGGRPVTLSGNNQRFQRTPPSAAPAPAPPPPAGT